MIPTDAVSLDDLCQARTKHRQCRRAAQQQLDQARLQAATAEARVGEIEKRAGDLHVELSRVNQQNSELVSALAAAARPTSTASGPVAKT